MINPEEIIDTIMDADNGEYASELLSDWLNSSRANKDEFIRLIETADDSHKSLWEGICLQWLNILHHQNISSHYDGRNEMSVKFGSKISKLEEVEYLNNLYGVNEDVEIILSNMAIEHKTIQDNFSQLIFKMLMNFNFEGKPAFQSVQKFICGT